MTMDVYMFILLWAIIHHYRHFIAQSIPDLAVESFFKLSLILIFLFYFKSPNNFEQ